MEGFKFRRQEPLGRYIADFVNYERKLVIELDGGQHALNDEKDKRRNEWFKNQRYEVLRFWDNEVLKNKDAVLETIRKKLLTPHLTSPARGEERTNKSSSARGEKNSNEEDEKTKSGYFNSVRIGKYKGAKSIRRNQKEINLCLREE